MEKKVLREDKIIFTVLTLVALIAIGIVTTWYFRKDNTLQENNSEVKENNAVKSINVYDFMEIMEAKPIVKEPKPKIVKPETKEEIKPEEPIVLEIVDFTPIVIPHETPSEDDFVLPQDLSQFIKVGRDLELITEINFGGNPVQATVVVEKLIDATADTWAIVEDVTNLAAGEYRYNYTYDGISKLQSFKVVEDLEIVDINKVNQDQTLEETYETNPFVDAELFNTVINNQANIDVAVDLLTKVHTITVKQELMNYIIDDKKKKLIGVILKINNLNYIDSIASANESIDVSQNNATLWGADISLGEVLLWIDQNELEYDKEYDIFISINNEIKCLTLKLSELIQEDDINETNLTNN